MRFSKNICLLIIAAAVSAAAPFSASADIVPADIKQVSPEGDYFRVVRQDNNKEMDIWLSVETRFEGLSSLHELVEGDEVLVDTQKNPDTGRWEADAVTVAKMVIRNPKSDVETMAETPAIPASVASMEDEARARIRNEMRQSLESMDKQIDALKDEASKTAQQQEKYDMLTMDLTPRREEAAARIAVLQVSSVVSWDQDKAAADKAVKELQAVMNTLERDLVIDRPAGKQTAEN